MANKTLLNFIYQNFSSKFFTKLIEIDKFRIMAEVLKIT